LKYQQLTSPSTMICCLNPQCRHPQNPDNVKVCQSCGTALTPLLRGRYRATEPLGQGGFGKTYLAMDEDRLGMRCVIKQFSPQIQGSKSMDKAISLFIQEALRLHELGEHPQIPTLLAYFEQDGYLYLVQQFIEGQNLLQEVRQKGAFQERQIRDVLAELLPVLRFIHRHQVIHRDITPTNILRRKSDNHLVLIDFGIAKQFNDGNSGQPGTRIGTEGYAPIEQFRGGRAYPSSDLYALGATCLYLMTQTKPDNLYDPLQGRWFWREYLQDRGTIVSDQLAHVLNMMLKDLVGERYQSVDEAMRDLNADYFLPPKSMLSQPAPTKSSSAATGKSASTSPSAAKPANGTAVPSKPPTSKPPTSKLPAAKPPQSRPPIIHANGRCIYTLNAHSSWVTSVAIAPSSQILASGSLDDTVRLWNLQKGELLTTLTGHQKGINAIVISPDGRSLTSASDDYTLKIWNINGTLIRTLTGHSRDVNAVAITPNGQILATGAEDRTIRLWHMGLGTLLKTILGVGSMVKSLTISPNGRVLISGGLDNKIKLWSLQTGQQVGLLVGHTGAVNALAISPDGQILASGSKDKTIRLWNLQTGDLIKLLGEHGREVNAIAFTPDGKLLISGSGDTTVKLWDLSAGEVKETLTGHTDSVNSVAVSADGLVFVTGSSDSTIRAWRL